MEWRRLKLHNYFQIPALQSVMAEAAQNKVQTAMKEFIENIDRSKLRPIQKAMYLCSADCMADMGAGMEEVR